MLRKLVLRINMIKNINENKIIQVKVEILVIKIEYEINLYIELKYFYIR